MTRFTMVEFPATSAHTSGRFLTEVFDFPATDYGPDYTDVDTGAGTSLGFQSDSTEASAAPLTVIEVDDLDNTRRRAVTAGATITKEAFDFPGGRRFQFTGPDGHEFAAWVPREAD